MAHNFIQLTETKKFILALVSSHAKYFNNLSQDVYFWAPLTNMAALYLRLSSILSCESLKPVSDKKLVLPLQISLVSANLTICSAHDSK